MLFVKGSATIYLICYILYRVQCQTDIDTLNSTETETDMKTHTATSIVSSSDNFSTEKLIETTQFVTTAKEEMMQSTLAPTITITTHSVSTSRVTESPDNIIPDTTEPTTETYTEIATVIETTTTSTETPTSQAMTEMPSEPTTQVITETSTESSTISSTIEDSEESTEMQESYITTYLPFISTWRTSSSMTSASSTEILPEESKNSLNISQFTVNECSFAGEKLDCDVWIKCFGEGEVNCDESEERIVPNESESESNPKFSKRHQHAIERPCKITGTLQCIPQPLMPTCKGKGKCKLVSLELAVEEGMEDWIVAVICISIGLGFFLLVMLTYVMYSSWKKLRVQPQTSSSTSYVAGQTA